MKKGQAFKSTFNENTTLAKMLKPLFVISVFIFTKNET